MKIVVCCNENKTTVVQVHSTKTELQLFQLKSQWTLLGKRRFQRIANRSRQFIGIGQQQAHLPQLLVGQ